MATKEFPPPVKWADDRLGIGKIGKKNLRKVFPDHWSFMLGEIALYSFIILILTGIFLTFWFKPSMAEVEYQGSYSLLKGLHMSEAYASTLDLSFDVRGGLLMRQIHHWAAVLFIAAMMVHLLRIFFTGAFRKPRELNWVIGFTMLFLGIIEGFIGYGLPDDLLSGTGLRITQGMIQSSPVIGTWLNFLIFGGEFPGDDMVPRFFTVHVLLIPGLILALVTAHLFLVVYHKHTQYPGPGRTEKNVVGYPLMPVYMAKAGGFFFVVFGITALMGALLQINPVWLYGPYNPAEVTAGSQPDWYMGWLEGSVRLMPGFESTFWGITLSWNLIIPALLIPPAFVTLVALYPFIEGWITGDKREHHLLDRPRNMPTRTGIGAAFITFYGLLWIAGGNDLIATHFGLSLNNVTWFLRFAVFIGPVLAFWVTRRVAISLQRADNDRLLHGLESGIIVRTPDGEYYEKHTPISKYEAYSLTAHDRTLPLEIGPETDDNGVRAPHRALKKVRASLSRFYFADAVQKPTATEIEEAHAHTAHEDDHHEAVEGVTGTVEVDDATAHKVVEH
ncbi:ubiquinol-cytochrome c reductase cytochrome b subunit [Kribbella orskensis]|uniref:Cytochrome bc1 complex cytochrome b subunit n=1 Tax=Kribbella orskensis TaxID=2512216 RepID=A0ABY2BS79_9ACTN|nr:MULTISPECIES: ubiquinol-cytochrome c reductase cytochrome b subunit [Kribbella]TCN42883.1 ubiquinol-cytochrome c reductase cytochrome b subunit [Kribbella sp. VKM Ac-2500]TCO29761.1 ubiquinol-cytochrome c reductase cytochrome b subunit [Kribbella orskensis]